ncbi:MAG: hypothetical protein U0P45_09585 [Acidimicrobiales bacterium]
MANAPLPHLRPRAGRARRTSGLVAAMAIAAVALAACGSSGSASGPTKVAPTATVDKPTTAPTSASTLTTQPATTAPATTGGATPSETAQRLYDAWKANDKAAAATVATPEAIAGMWQTAPGDYGQYSGCDTGEFSTSGCLYRGNPGTIQIDMERKGDLWVVVDAYYSDPSSGG